MKLTTPVVALSLALSASASTATGSSAMQNLGCFSDRGQLEDEGSYVYQSIGYCVNLCQGKGKSYAALQKDHCFCGDVGPKDSVSDDMCDESCAGFVTSKCGGDDAWSVYQLGSGDGGSSSASTSDSMSMTSATIIATPTASVGAVSSSKPIINGASATSSSASVEPTPTPNMANRHRSFLF